jgi:hypothetical protein
MARLSGSTGRYAPESGPIMLALSFVVHDPLRTPPGSQLKSSVRPRASPCYAVSFYPLGTGGVELDTRDGWAVMSKRFLRWAETWIEENIPPGANPDIESHEARAKRLSEKLLAEATEGGFTSSEAEEEMERVSPLVLAAVSNSTDFDIDAYHLKSQLAQENEDGD